MQYDVLKNVPGHLKMQDEVTLKLWPEFMLHDPVSNANWETLFLRFPEFQISLVSGEDIIGVANSLPFHWDRSFEELPEEGWDWVLQKGIRDHEQGVRPNVLNGLQISVNREYQSLGVSILVLQELLSLAAQHGFEYLTIPVRPSLKSRYPLTSMEHYMQWKREDGLPFDPWLRVQLRLGGRIVKSCPRAMYIPGTVGEWEAWTDMKFPESGEYVVPGALSPVKADVERDLVEYIEPNVWVLHTIPAKQGS